MSTLKKFESTDVVTGRIQEVSTGLFPGGRIEQSSFFTSSYQTITSGSSTYDIKSGLYYYDVYSANPETSNDAEVLFSVTYGNSNGSGSCANDKAQSKIYPTKAVYSQYKNLILTPEDSLFTFQSGEGSSASQIESEDIYVITFSNNKFKERLDAGLFEFSIQGSSSIITLVDDSTRDTTGGITKKSVYNIVEGKLETNTTSAIVGAPDGIGLFYPNLGIIILNANRLSQLADGSTKSLLPTDGGIGWDWALNHVKLFNGMQACVSTNPMIARSSEFVPSRQYFIRVKNQEFNYSNNPSFVLSSAETGNLTDDGKIRFPDFYQDPRVYITTVGLYDDNDELVAVAKLSQPFLKSFDNEALVKIKLNM